MKNKILKNRFEEKMIEENYIELVDIEEIEYTNKYENMIDISIDIDESFSLSNGIVSHNSASSTIITGFATTGRDYYGVFPLKGKPLNVRKSSMQKILENEEIKNIILALGLEFNHKYNDVNELRYGKLVFAGDADCVDGETLIKTKNGNKKIKHLTYDDQVLSHTGNYQNILNIIETKKEKYVEIKYNNEIFKFSEYHKLIIQRDGNIEIIFAKDILNTDLILIKK